jgi:hypothetical protein
MAKQQTGKESDNNQNDQAAQLGLKPMQKQTETSEEVVRR